MLKRSTQSLQACVYVYYNNLKVYNTCMWQLNDRYESMIHARNILSAVNQMADIALRTHSILIEQNIVNSISQKTTQHCRCKKWQRFGWLWYGSAQAQHRSNDRPSNMFFQISSKEYTRVNLIVVDVFTLYLARKKNGREKKTKSNAYYSLTQQSRLMCK